MGLDILTSFPTNMKKYAKLIDKAKESDRPEEERAGILTQWKDEVCLKG